MLTARLLDKEKAAAYLGMEKGALVMRVWRKQIPCIRVGRRVFFDVKALDQWIEAQAQTAAGVTVEEALRNR